MSKVLITDLVYKVQVKRVQSDEYIEITNFGSNPTNLSGWKITSIGKNEEFIFTSGTELQSGKSFRIYTNEVHPEYGGFSFGKSRVIWNDKADEGKL